MFPMRDPYQEVLNEASARAYNYLRTIQERHVGVLQEALEKLPALGGPMPESGEDPRAIIQLLDEVGSPATMASMGPRMFGGVIGGAFPAAVAAHWLADAWDQNACLFDFAPVAAYLEDVVLSWLLDLFGLPATSGGAFVTGTQMSPHSLPRATMF
jgi:glutamate/tyrosine decarboxylase-like PLP-dependent enzyme